MKKAKLILIIIAILFFLFFFTDVKNQSDNEYTYFEDKPVSTIEDMLVFKPKKPIYIPFEVDSNTASMQSYTDKEDGFSQNVSFHYSNDLTNQLLNLIISYNSPIGLPDGKEIVIKENVYAILDYDDNAQSIWWIEDDLVYRFVYFIYEGQAPLTTDDFQKLINSMN